MSRKQDILSSIVLKKAEVLVLEQELEALPKLDESITKLKDYIQDNFSDKISKVEYNNVVDEPNSVSGVIVTLKACEFGMVENIQKNFTNFYLYNIYEGSRVQDICRLVFLKRT